MGGKESKNSPVSYEDALSKVTDAELRRLRDAYRRCAGPNGNIALNAFHSDVLGGAVPRPIAEQIYSSLSGGKGMTFKDLLCLLVLITSGTRQERAQLLHNLYAGENGLVSYETLFRNALDEDREYLSHIRNMPPMSFPEFYRYICARPDTTVVSRWLLSTAPGLTISDDVETPTFYQTLAGVTHLEEKEIMSLEKKYWAFNGRLDEDAFGHLVSPPIPDGVKSLLFRAFDENRDEQIDFKELACGVSASCCGPVAERHKFCFKVFDVDGDGCLSEEEIRIMARGLLEARVEVRRGDPTSPVFFSEKDSEIKDCDIDEVVAAVLASRHDEDGKVKLQDYLVWALSSPLTVNFLSLLREVCIITLGLPPADREEEGTVVLRWLTREERRGLRAGAFWFLVDSKWWREWSDYVSSPQSPHGDILPSGASTNSISLASTNSSPAGSRYGSLKRGSAGKRLTSSTLASDSDSGVIMTSCQQIYPDELSPVNSLSISSSSRLTRNGPSRSPSPMPSPKLCRRTPPCTPSPAVGGIVRPGPIDNSGLLAPVTAKQAVPITGEGGRLRRNVERKRDYELVPDSLWKALNLWYGGGPALPRQVIYKDVDAADDVEIELHPKFFKLWRHQAVKKPNGNGVAGNGNEQQSNSALFSTYGLMAGYSPAAMGSGGLSYFPALTPTTPRRYLAYVAAFSRSATWQQVLTYICSRLRLQPEDVRLWLYRDENNLFLIEDDLCLLENVVLGEEESVLIEIRDKDQTWPEEMSLLAKNPEVKIRANQPVAAGATGLNNLGNTCFLNAAVQCVSNTAPLTKYFLKDMHLYELNRENPLGMKGHVAKRYGDLIKDIWNGSSKTLAPIKLKYTIGRYAPRFNCFQQQDSQELLAFLLDGLHEDLNRVHVKPYATLKDSDGRPDIEVAQEAWENHILRNKSVIVDLFHGQLKSKVTCKVCCHESVRFDPFTYLTLPLPMENFVRAEVILIRFDGALPFKFGVRVEYEANFGSIKDELEKLSGIPSDRILLVQLSGPVIKEVINDNFRVRDWNSFLATGTLFGYEVADSRAEGSKAASLRVPNGPSLSTPEPVDTSANEEPELIPPSTSSSPTPSSMSSAESDPGAGLPEIRAPKIAVAYHRKTMRQDSYFLSVHKTKASLFGVPLVIPFPKEITNIELYEAVWVRVSRLVSPAPVVDSTGANHAQDCDDSLGYEFPFTLKAVNAEGTACAWCHWYDFCRGCTIPPTDAAFVHPSPEVLANNNPNGTPKMFSYFAIDWDPTAIHLRYQSGLERAFEAHESVERTEKEQNEPISLERCLEAFTKEEELGENEKYFCTKCKCHQLAKIKLEIWRLPPILIIHLKRFQCVGNRWMKSHKLVKFPFTDFHPERFLASVPRTTIERHKSGFKEMPPAANPPAVGRSLSVADTIPEEGKLREDEEGGDDELKELRDGLQEIRRTLSGNGDSPEKSLPSAAGGPPPPLPRRRRERLDSVTKCALQSTALQDFHQHKLKPEADPFNLTYDLYAVIKHSGIMGGGHYTCYAMNAMTRKWFFYNDSSCKEVDGSQIDCDFAYILFYARRDLDEAQYLPHIPPNLKLPDVSDLEDELETDYRKYCSIM